MEKKDSYNFIEKTIIYTVEHRFFQMILKKINKMFLKIARPIDMKLSVLTRKRIAKTTEIEKNKVVFMSYNNDYICNPKYICEEIVRQELPIDMVWATTGKKMKNPQKYNENLRLVRRGSYFFFKEVASAKVWIDNAVCFPWDPIDKKEGQYYIQTWHGSMGLKRIGKDDVKDPRWNAAAAKENKWVDVCISNSTFETEVFRETHWPDVPILEYGHARNDIFFVDEEEKKKIRKKVLDFYYLDDDVNLVLYAPTFRNKPLKTVVNKANTTTNDTNDNVDNANTENVEEYNPYTMDYSRLLDILEEQYGGKWILLNRFHFKSKGGPKSNILDKRIRQATGYPDMQELMVASDIGITDYSSWICDFVLSKKPAFIYASDIDEYNEERGFYYPLESTPFPIAKDTDELEQKIRSFDKEKYLFDCDTFLEARGCKEQGEAAKQIVELIKKQCLE